MTNFNLGNVVGLIRSTQEPDYKKYIIWAKVLNVETPDIVELHYYDGVSESWVSLTSATASYWLKPVINIVTSSPPPAPSNGDRYLIADSASGAWSGKTDQVAEFRANAWIYQEPLDGYILTSKDTPNVIYIYEGTYGVDGEWVENNFNTEVNTNDFVKKDQANSPGGYLALDAEGNVNVEFIPSNLLSFIPQNAANWNTDTNTIWKALEELKSKNGEVFNPSSPDSRPTNFTIGNIPAGTLIATLRGKSAVKILEQAMLGVTHPNYLSPTLSLNATGNVRVEVGTILNPSITLTFTKRDAGDLENIRIFKRTPTDGDSYVNVADGGLAPASTLNLEDGPIQLESGQTVSYYGYASWLQGPVLLNDDNELDPVGQIPAGNAQTSTRRWYTEKKVFAGVGIADPTTSALVRALTHYWETQGLIQLVLVGGEPSACIVIPAGRTLTKVESVSLVTADITSSFLATEQALTIEGANPGASFEYDVKKYYLQPGAPFTAQTLKFYFS